MNCDACGHEHAITGQVKVDGIPLPESAIEAITEILCKHGKLGLTPRDERISPGASADAAPIRGSYHEPLDEPNP